MAVLDIAISARASNDNDVDLCDNKQLVADEQLSVVAYKLNWMAPDTVIQLCSSFYSDEAGARWSCG